MEFNDNNINEFINKYIAFVDKLNNKYDYPNNIKHVLYLIIPAFVKKYGIKEERYILNCFENIPIYISSNTNHELTAYFNRKLGCESEDGRVKYYTEKEIVLNEYYGASLLELIDNLAHEFNHAINSLNNELTWNDNIITMRTGLSHFTYKKEDTCKIVSESSDITLEEIINTKQTEDIVNIINSFNQYHITNNEFNNALYTLKHDIDTKGYVSNAYYFQSYICKELMKNKTFIKTVENLRFKGEVNDIESWFDNITGISGSYKKLNILLDEILKTDSKLANIKLFKKYNVNKVIRKSREVLDIIKIFDNNCIYK